MTKQKRVYGLVTVCLAILLVAGVVRANRTVDLWGGDGDDYAVDVQFDNEGRAYVLAYDDEPDPDKREDDPSDWVILRYERDPVTGEWFGEEWWRYYGGDYLDDQPVQLLVTKNTAGVVIGYVSFVTVDNEVSPPVTEYCVACAKEGEEEEEWVRPFRDGETACKIVDIALHPVPEVAAPDVAVAGTSANGADYLVASWEFDGGERWKETLDNQGAVDVCVAVSAIDAVGGVGSYVAVTGASGIATDRDFWTVMLVGSDGSVRWFAQFGDEGTVDEPVDILCGPCGPSNRLVFVAGTVPDDEGDDDAAIVMYDAEDGEEMDDVQFGLSGDDDTSIDDAPLKLTFGGTGDDMNLCLTVQRWDDDGASAIAVRYRPTTQMGLQFQWSRVVTQYDEDVEAVGVAVDARGYAYLTANYSSSADCFILQPYTVDGNIGLGSTYAGDDACAQAVASYYSAVSNADSAYCVAGSDDDDALIVLGDVLSQWAWTELAPMSLEPSGRATAAGA